MPDRILRVAALFGAALFGAVLLGSAGCDHAKGKPTIEYMPNMAYGPRLAAQHEDPLRPGYSVQRLPVEGTVPRDITPYRFAQADTAQAMTQLSNPLPRTAEILARGRKVYMNTCVVCHGEKGDGQGYIVPLYPTPPQLFSDKVRGWPDGRIFHVITRGQNLMPSYASQILPEDRWAVVHYVRALQRAAHPLPEDLPKPAGSDSTRGAPAGSAQGAARAPADSAPSTAR